MRPAPVIDEMMTQQLVGTLLGIAYDTFGLYYGMGTGKSLIVLRLLQYWYELGRIRKALIFEPSAEAVSTMADEIGKWRIPLPFVTLDESSSYDKAVKMLALDRGIVIASYPGVLRMVSSLVENKKRDKNEMKLDHRAVDIICKDVGAVVYDESTESKNTKSLTFRVCRAISKRVPIRYALAGRPFGKDPFDLWAQMFLIDRGASLGTTQEIFRAAFYNAKPGFFGGVDYKLKPDMADEINRRTGHRSLTYSTEECVDLPPLSRPPVHLHFPEETLAYYDKVVEHLIGSRGDRAIIENDFIRLRQLGSGFLGVASDEYGARAEIEFDQNPKLDFVLEKLSQMPYGRKAVIFFEYIYSGKRISTALRKAKIKHALIWSGAKDRKTALQRFLHDPECEVLVVNHMIGAYSLNLQCANYIFVYENAVGCIDRDQLIRRCWRKGQKRRVFLFDLCMIGGVEDRILAIQAAGGDVYQAVMRDPEIIRRRERKKPAKMAENIR